MDINNSKETFQQQKPKENTLCARNLEPLKPHQKALILEAIFTRNFLSKCLYPLNYTRWAVKDICARWECKNGLFKRIDSHVWQLQLYIDIVVHVCFHVQIAQALTHIGGKLPQAAVEVVEVVEVAEVVEVEASQVAALVAAAS